MNSFWFGFFEYFVVIYKGVSLKVYIINCGLKVFLGILVVIVSFFLFMRLFIL